MANKTKAKAKKVKKVVVKDEEETKVEETVEVKEEIGTQDMPEEVKDLDGEVLKEEEGELAGGEKEPARDLKVEEPPEIKEEEIVADSVATITAPVIIKDNAAIVLASISHPNKKILAEKILSKRVPVEELIALYGNTRVLEMSRYISSAIANLEKNADLRSKRGCNGVCVACQN